MSPLKRAFDLLLALLALMVVAVPFLVITVVLKLTGQGKAWYFQDRIGYQGEIFRAFKFVTMRTGSERKGARYITVRSDPRVLPVGRVLRMAKLNELPQVFNVLRGDMSVVGWRPLIEQGFADYPAHVREGLVQIRPGLTGLGSIVFRDEEAILTDAQLQGKKLRACYREDILPYKGALELWYRDQSSLWVDLKLILLTVLAIVAPRNGVYRKWFKGLPEPQSPLVREHCGFPPLPAVPTPARRKTTGTSR